MNEKRSKQRAGVGDSFHPPPGSIPTLSVPEAARWRALHLVGIGGAGMSGIARLLLARGVSVTGSDLKDTLGLDALRSLGATVRIGHSAEHVGSPDAVVISSAIPPGNPEVGEARRRGLPVLMRAQVLAALMHGRRAVAVAGTHGKTTTTSMISVMLSRTGREPTFVIGGDLNESGSGAKHGESDLFVAEADESDGSFLLLRPEVGVVTNIEDDHLDFYRERRQVDAAFARFAGSCGTVVACIDDAGVRRMLRATSGASVLAYGTEDGADLHLSVLDLRPDGARGIVNVSGRDVSLDLRVAGQHNLLNATAALGVALRLDVPLQEAADALGTFTGVRRRFELRGTARGARFVDDYAHHPTEIKVTLRTAGDAEGRLLAVFQPHRYTRTEAMWRSLGQSLAAADMVVVTDVYGAGEHPIPGVSGKLVVDSLTEAAPGKRVVYLPRRSDVAPFLASEVRGGDLILTLGAGDITMVAEETLERLEEVYG